MGFTFDELASHHNECRDEVVVIMAVTSLKVQREVMVGRTSRDHANKTQRVCPSK
jgi:hypothetical protein